MHNLGKIFMDFSVFAGDFLNYILKHFHKDEAGISPWAQKEENWCFWDSCAYFNVRHFTLCHEEGLTRWLTF